MELRVLKYFLAVAEEQNITAAAEVLHVTQPTLSRQIQDLEDELGKALFIRSNKKTVLTEDGMHLKKRAEELISLAEQTSAEFRSTKDTLYGELRIGAGETDAMSLVGTAMKNMYTKQPAVRYSVFSGNADSVIERLNHGILDFGLLLEPVDKENFNYIPVPVSDRAGILVLKDGPYGKYDKITPDNIKDIPLLIASRQNFSQSFASWCGADVNKLNIIGSFNLINNAALMVRAGLGNALSLENLINTTGTSRLRFIPLEPRIMHPMVLVWKKSQFLSGIAQLFLQEIQAEFDRVSKKKI
jgi:DNA-binding transcriptional LysR family regulator